MAIKPMNQKTAIFQPFERMGSGTIPNLLKANEGLKYINSLIDDSGGRDLSWELIDTVWRGLDSRAMQVIDQFGELLDHINLAIMLKNSDQLSDGIKCATSRIIPKLPRFRIVLINKKKAIAENGEMWDAYLYDESDKKNNFKPHPDNLDYYDMQYLYTSNKEAASSGYFCNTFTLLDHMRDVTRNFTMACREVDDIEWTRKLTCDHTSRCDHYSNYDDFREYLVFSATCHFFSPSKGCEMPELTLPRQPKQSMIIGAASDLYHSGELESALKLIHEAQSIHNLDDNYLLLEKIAIDMRFERSIKSQIFVRHSVVSNGLNAAYQRALQLEVQPTDEVLHPTPLC